MRICSGSLKRRNRNIAKKKNKAEALLYAPENGHERISAAEEKSCETYGKCYKHFLDAGKTERECVVKAVAQAEKAGFRPFVRGAQLKARDKIYRVNRGTAWWR